MSLALLVVSCVQIATGTQFPLDLISQESLESPAPMRCRRENYVGRIESSEFYSKFGISTESGYLADTDDLHIRVHHCDVPEIDHELRLYLFSPALGDWQLVDSNCFSTDDHRRKLQMTLDRREIRAHLASYIDGESIIYKVALWEADREVVNHTWYLNLEDAKIYRK